MPARAYWDGHIRLSLVTFPVRLFAAVTDSEKIKLHKIDRKSGKRVHYKNSTEDKSEVEASDIVKGYEYEKGHYIEIEDKELQKLKVESKHTIELVQFVDSKEIDAIYFDNPYYVVPNGKVAQEAYVTVRESLRAEKKVALGQITIAGKERIAAIKPCGKGLILETLRYANEVRTANEIFEDIPENVALPKDQIELAAMLIKSKAGHFDPSSFKDSYQVGLMEIINAKLDHRAPSLPEAGKEPGNVVNIMDALKRSLAQSDKSDDTDKKPVKEKKAAAKKTSAKETAKPAAKKKKKAA